MMESAERHMPVMNGQAGVEVMDFHVYGNSRFHPIHLLECIKQFSTGNSGSMMNISMSIKLKQVVIVEPLTHVLSLKCSLTKTSQEDARVPILTSMCLI